VDVLDLHGDKHVRVRPLEIVLATITAVVRSTPRPISPIANRWIATSGDHAADFFGGTDLRNDDPFSAGIEHPLQERNFGAGNTYQRRSAASAGGDQVAEEGFQADRVVLQVDPEEINAVAERLRDRRVGETDPRAQAKLPGREFVSESLHVARHRSHLFVK